METIEFRQSSFRDFLHVIFKRKNQILLFFAVTVCTVVIGTFVIKPVYEAKAQILVKIGRENLYIPPNSTNSQIINFNRDNQINSEIELLKSRSLAENVIKSLGPKTIYKNIDHKDTVLRFQKSLSVEGIKKSDVIAVSFKHKDPKMAAKIVNTLAIFLGGFGGLGLAFFGQYLDDSLEKPEDVEKELQLPVLASIPELTEIEKLKVGV